MTVESGDEAPAISISLFARWHGKAVENVDEWGLQDEETLLLAMQEELGELTQAFLEARDEDGDPECVDWELDDLGALLFQLHMVRHGGETVAE